MVQARRSTPIRLFLGMKPLAVRMQDDRCHRSLPDYHHLSRSSTMVKPTPTATPLGPLTLLTATKEPTISEGAVLCAMIQESLRRPVPGHGPPARERTRIRHGPGSFERDQLNWEKQFISRHSPPRA
jgi:hypothetical protein